MVAHPIERLFQCAQPGSPAIRQPQEAELRAAICDVIKNLNDLVAQVGRIIAALDESTNAKRPTGVEAFAPAATTEHRNTGSDETAEDAPLAAAGTISKFPLVPQQETLKPNRCPSEIANEIGAKIRAAFAAT